MKEDKKGIKPEKVFSVFEDYEEETSGVSLREIKETVWYKLKVFDKLMSSKEEFYKKFMKGVKHTDDDYNKIKNIAVSMLMNRAYKKLEFFDFKDESHTSGAASLKSKTFNANIEELKLYYAQPQLENYEKCAFLQKIQDCFKG